LNLVGPPIKSKYNLMIDSEKVLWRNDEKNQWWGEKSLK